MDFSIVEASGSYSLVVVCGLLTVVASLVAEHGSQGCTGFSSCGTRAQQLWLPVSTAQAQ